MNDGMELKLFFKQNNRIINSTLKMIIADLES